MIENREDRCQKEVSTVTGLVTTATAVFVVMTVLVTMVIEAATSNHFVAKIGSGNHSNGYNIDGNGRTVVFFLRGRHKESVLLSE